MHDQSLVSSLTLAIIERQPKAGMCRSLWRGGSIIIVDTKNVLDTDHDPERADSRGRVV